MDALEAIAARHSSRHFSAKPLSSETIEKIVDAGRLASTARNVQPWEFVVVTESETRKKIAGLTDNGKFIEQAPACVALFCRDTKYFLEDGSAATQNILIAAAALRVQSCWVAGDKKPYAADIGRLLNAPDSSKLVSLIALGYDERATVRPVKRPLAEVLHWERFQGRK
jgi:nitroreductase